MEFTEYLKFLVESKDIDDEKYFNKDVLDNIIDYPFALKKNDATGDYVKYSLKTINSIGEYFIIVRPYSKNRIGMSLVLKEAGEPNSAPFAILFEKVVGTEDEKNYKQVVKRFIGNSISIVNKIGEL